MTFCQWYQIASDVAHSERTPIPLASWRRAVDRTTPPAGELPAMARTRERIEIQLKRQGPPWWSWAGFWLICAALGAAAGRVLP